MTEWLGALGLAWPRLLIYPGGLFVLLFAWLLDRILGKQQPAANTHGQLYPMLVDISAVVLPLVLISLLPLPLSGFFGYTPDLLTALLLIEWPLCLVVARMHHDNLDHARLAGYLWPNYLMLILSILVLVQSNGSFRLDMLTRSIETDSMATYFIWLVGLLGWWVALVPLVNWHTLVAGEQVSIRWGLRLRTAGHVFLALLPALALTQGNRWLALFLLASLVGWLTAATRYHQWLTQRQKHIARTAIYTALILVLCWETYAALVNRLR